MSMLCIATTQFACSWDLGRNLDQAEQLVRQAAAQGAQVILLQELFATPYFCIEQDHKHLALAEDFSPGDTGFRVWDTAYGRLGLGICWDQWFPETARCLALMGAEVLLFPTAIGSEPGAAALDSRDHWQMAMRGHAAANILPVIAANRVGREVASNDPELAMSFYGSSFISNHKGKLLAEADRDSTGVLVQALDLAAMREERLTWGIYRDRRPEMYGPLLGLDGRQSHVRWAARGALDV